MNSRKFLISSVAFALLLLVNGCCSHRSDPAHPLLAVLDRFRGAPEMGPAEADLPVRALPTNAVAAHWPGRGLKQHPFLIYGEGNNVLYVVDHGRVIWRYAFPRGGEIDDAWMLSNGNIICTKMTDCYEVTPEKH